MIDDVLQTCPGKRKEEAGFVASKFLPNFAQKSFKINLRKQFTTVGNEFMMSEI